jgi:hypothetical protein
MIRDDSFGFAEYFKPVVDSITGPDTYLLANDFDSYLAAQVSDASLVEECAATCAYTGPVLP